MEQVYWHHLSNSICSHVSMSHGGNSHNISHFSLLLYLLCDLWSLIFDITIVIGLGCHEPLPHKITDLIDKCCMCSDCSTNWPFPSISLFLGLPSPWDKTIWKLGSLRIPHWPLTVQVKGRVSYLPLNQKLEMIKLSEEGVLKVKTGWRLDPVCQTIS